MHPAEGLALVVTPEVHVPTPQLTELTGTERTPGGEEDQEPASLRHGRDHDGQFVKGRRLDLSAAGLNAGAAQVGRVLVEELVV
jgi:hypothetical protein